MARWQKLLSQMLKDGDPRNYTYQEAALVLERLGFVLKPHGGTSHRMWRFRNSDGLVTVIGLVEHGSGTLKPVYIRDLVKQLREHHLVPPDLE